MKIKEIDRTANAAWSPAQQYPIYLATGTAAHQLDSSFNTNSNLELYALDVTKSNIDIPVTASTQCESRFHKLVWGAHGMGQESKDGLVSGVLVGGFDEGVMKVYDANKVLHKQEDPVVLTKNKHTGPVRALDFNSFRSYLIASGAGESEIFIWDLNNPKTPMSPGTKVQPPDDVTCLAWNKQVEHILASTFSSRCVVWDLRKNEPIIKLADTASKIRYKVVQWHPTTATQMCLASEDDSSPVIQLWDLRYATSPLKVLQGHERGVLGLAWCDQDPDLLLSCGKDNHIYCWNPNIPYAGYELVCDIPTSSQWSFDVSISPRNPLVISSSSFDGRVSIFSLSGGSQTPVSSSKLADSFPGMDMDVTHTPVPTQKPEPVNLRDAPKWLKRPCGASFAFGGKLITFSNVKQAQQGQGSGDGVDKRIVSISQVVTLPEFVARSQKLETALQSGSLENFCAEKAYLAKDPSESKVWQFLQASFSRNPAEVFLAMLGFDSNELQEKLSQIVAKFPSDPVDSITDGFVSLGRGMTTLGNQIFPSDNLTLFDTLSQSSTRSVTPEPGKQFSIPTDESTEGLLNQSILSGNIEYAVDICLKESRWADALILASMGSPDLVKKAQLKYFHKCETETSNMIRAVVTRDLKRLVERCELEHWAQALACALNYANDTEFPVLAEILGKRLECSRNESLRKNALLCYICSGDMNRLTDGWMTDDSGRSSTPDALQDLIEQIMVLKKASELKGRASTVTNKTLASKLVQYATLLVSQGCLESALHYVTDADEPSMVMLRESLNYSLGLARPAVVRSIFQTRSRQASESSTSGRHAPLTKRPSYPSVVPPAMSNPALQNTALIDSRRMSNHLIDPNIASLTGPPVPPASTYSYGATNYNSPGDMHGSMMPPPKPMQPMAPPSSSYSATSLPPHTVGAPPTVAPVGLPPVPPPPTTNPPSAPTPMGHTSNISAPPVNFYNPINVNVNNSTTPNWNSTPAQPSPYSSQSYLKSSGPPSPARPAQTTFFNPNESAKDSRGFGSDFGHTPTPNLASAPPPLLPASIVPPTQSWNDPPMLKDGLMSKPKKPVAAAPRMDPITHPIFGAAAPPEPQHPPQHYMPMGQQPQQQQQQMPYQNNTMPPVPPAGGVGYGYNYNYNLRR